MSFQSLIRHLDVPDTDYWYDSECDAARKIIDEHVDEIFRQLLAEWSRWPRARQEHLAYILGVGSSAKELALIKERELQFKDPDDNVSSIYNDHTQRDGIAGSYYGVKARYGGPLKNMLWYGDYDLQLEKIDSSRTKLRLEYKLYGRDFEPQSLRISLLDAIKES